LAARAPAVLLGLLLLAATVACSGAGSGSGRGASQARLDASGVRSFSFAAAGDLGATRHSTAFLDRLDRSDARFFLALGDLDYDNTPTDAAWCRYVDRHLPSKGDRFGFEVLVGNHEQDGGPDGRIDNFARCLPDRMGSVGRYGAQYAFTFPRKNPYAAFVLVSPNLTVAGHTYRYQRGTADRRWLVRQIDAARARGIRWVVVAMHYPCLTTGTHGCDSGSGIVNLLVRKRVDLLLTGHNHVYERSKQLRLRPGCARLSPRRYDADCVVDAGADGRYTKGRGTVQVTAGIVAGREQGFNPRDPSARYFAVRDGVSTGFVHYTVTPTSLRARFVSTGGPLSDAFEIVAR
jgi:hypothetical protein